MGFFREPVESLKEHELRDYAHVKARLDLNESPYPPPQHIVEAASRELLRCNRYPDRRLLSELIEAVAEYTGARMGNIVVGPGGEGILGTLFQGTVERGDTVVYPVYSFVAYRILARITEALPLEIPMKPRGSWWVIDEDKLVSGAREARLTVIDRPNNPTGSVFPSIRRIEELLEEARGLVVVDEAYYEFHGETAAHLVESHENLVVIRSFSKAFGLAGLRIGYAIASPSVARVLRAMLPPFPASRPAIAAAAAALKNPGYVREYVEYVSRERGRLLERLSGLPGVKPYNSRASFVLVETGVDEVVGKLYERGVAVSRAPMGSNWFRASIGSREENNLLIEALDSIIKQG